MSADAIDSDGDEISEGQPYRFAVLTIPKNRDTWNPSLEFSAQDLILSQNNQVKDFSSQLSLGSGSLAIDQDGKLAMATYDIIGDLSPDWEIESALYRFNLSGSFIELAIPFRLMGGNAFNSKNILFQSIISTGEVLMIEGSNLIPMETSGFPITNPDGIYIDANDMIFLVDHKNGNVVKVDQNGVAELYATADFNARGITGDDKGNIYVSINDEEGKIIKIDPQREVSVFANVPTFVPDSYLLEFIMWVGYLTYHDQNLYVAGLSTHRIYRIDMQGNVSVFAGTGTKLLPKGGALTAHFNRPMGLAFSQDGKSLFVSGCLDVVPQHVQSSTPSKVYEIQIVE